MLTISKQQLYNRYDSLPQELKDLFFSEEADGFLSTIGEEHHLSDEKISLLATNVGDVILGFIHPDDLAKYITADLGVDARLAQALATEIEKKIFASLLTELRQNYKGMAATAPASVDSGITKTELVYKEPEHPAMVLAEEAKPAELKTYFNQLNGKAAATEGGKQIEVEKREIQAAPAIIHTETETKPVTKVKSTFGGLMGIFSGGSGKSKEETVAAEVQFSGQQQGKVESKESGISLQPQPRLVHYTALRTPLTDLQLKTSEIPVAKRGDFVPQIINLEPLKSGDKKEIAPLNQWLLEKDKNKIQPAIQPIAEFLNQKASFIKGPAYMAGRGMEDLKKGQTALEPLGQWLVNKEPIASKEEHDKLIAEEFTKLQMETKAKKSGGILGFFGKSGNNAEQPQDNLGKISMNPILNPLESASLKKVVEKNFTESDIEPIMEVKPQEKIAVQQIQPKSPIAEMPKTAFEIKPLGEFRPAAGQPKVVDFTAASMAESAVKAEPIKPLEQIKPEANVLGAKPAEIKPTQVNQLIDHEEHKKIVENHINQSERESFIGNIADIKISTGKPEMLQQNIPQPVISMADGESPALREKIEAEKKISPEIQPSISPKIEARPEAVKQPEPDISKIELKHLPVEEDIIDLRNL